MNSSNANPTAQVGSDLPVSQAQTTNQPNTELYRTQATKIANTHTQEQSEFSKDLLDGLTGEKWSVLSWYALSMTCLFLGLGYYPIDTLSDIVITGFDDFDGLTEGYFKEILTYSALRIGACLVLYFFFSTVTADKARKLK